MTVEGFVLNSPGPLSQRAQRFLTTRAHRVDFDRGLTGDALAKKIEEVYGRSRVGIVSLLDRLQERYGGLTYKSGYFDEQATFSPVCEPDDPSDEPEILYAVTTGAPTGASVHIDGVVEIGFDERGIAEFASLDYLIECDAIFDVAGEWSESKALYLDKGIFSEVHARLLSGEIANVEMLPEATGNHSSWFLGEDVGIFVCRTWSELQLPMQPFMKIWSADERVAGNVANRVLQG